ncbi:ECs1072 family phage-associated protein [Klebsiella aerogenes]|nr:hypothetical protein [Klebsiella aerogenes]
MSVINAEYFHQIQNKIAALREVQMVGYVTPEYYKVQNRAALVFSLEVLLDAHRKKYGHLTSPLKGKLALEHLLLNKYKWPLSVIRGLSLQDSILLLQQELALEALPGEAQDIIKNYNAHRATNYFEEILEDEWDPELYLTIPKPQNW